MTTKQFYDEHIEMLEGALKTGDPKELVNEHYCDDAEMIVHSTDPPTHKIGKAQVLELFENYIKNIYRGFISTEKLVCSDDSIFLEATINSAYGVLKVYDALYLKDGKIFRHYGGVK